MYIKSPLYYNGNKYSLLNKIIPRIPKNSKGCFYDLFGGSGTVSINMAKYYNKVYYNELNPVSFKMFKWALFDADPKHIRKRMIDLDHKYGFIIDIDSQQRESLVASRKSNLTKEYKGWKRMIQEERINTDADPELLFIASCYSFSNTMKFKNDGYLQSSWGVYNFSEKYIEKFDNLKTINNIHINKGSFSELDISKLTEDDFVYLDPPYWGTQANYNKTWNWNQEEELIQFCNELIKNNIKFAMSNVFSNKGKTNDHLIKWAKNNNLKVHHFNHNYHINGSAGIADEVLITNHIPPGYTEQISFNF